MATGETMSEEQKAKYEFMLAKSNAVRIAMNEILQENRTEIIRRATAKLKDLGLAVSEGEMGKQLET